MSKTEEALKELSREYWERGYVVLRGLFEAEEVAQWSQECERLLLQDWVSENNARTPFRNNSKITPERIDPVIDVSPAFANLVQDGRIARALRAIWGEEPLLFKDKLIFKMPGVEGYAMHQDFAWGWQGLCGADDILSVSVQIDGADADNGCIELFPDYHRELLTPAGLQTNFRAEEKAKIDENRGEKIATNPGDVLIFHSLAPHQSGKNTSTSSRRSLYLTYNRAGVGNLRAAYYESYISRSCGEGQFFR